MTNGKNLDKYPQLMYCGLVEPAANTFTAAAFNTPVVSSGDGKVWVMNILRIHVFHPAGDDLDDDSTSVLICDREPAAMLSYNTPGVIFRDQMSTQIVTSGGVNFRAHGVVEFGDGNGHGLLFGKKQIWAAVQGGSQGAAQGFQFAIEYTLVQVGAEEYIGMVDQTKPDAIPNFFFWLSFYSGYVFSRYFLLRVRIFQASVFLAKNRQEINYGSKPICKKGRNGY